MIRNEYRRAFIMLRAVMPGYGGHVRLERRTLTGSMYFIITAPQGVGELAAAAKRRILCRAHRAAEPRPAGPAGAGVAVRPPQHRRPAPGGLSLDRRRRHGRALRAGADRQCGGLPDGGRPRP